MYLEKLEIQGFKSFANKNKLVFSGILDNKKRGITVVVGPNGSGKSNIADSIRWVLGEQSTKLLRSKKSEDVIFSGSDKKSRLNMSEVSLFLNNEANGFYKKNDDETLLADDQSEADSIDALMLLPEIVITRRVFRDGNSEYCINNNRVRLGDVQMFLAKANFGQKTYSVIGQGMVENFLNTSPAERKAFFDEATGVKQYQIKRDLSLNKLETSQENLSKVEMLLNEIEPRLKSLTRQVAKLKKRNFLEDELFNKQLNYYSRIWQEIDNKLQIFLENITKLEKDKEQLVVSLEKNKKHLEGFNQEETIGEEFYKLQKRFLSLQSERDETKEQLDRLGLWQEIKNKQKEKADHSLLDSLVTEKTSLEEKVKENIEELENFKKGFSNQDKLDQLEKGFADKEREIGDKYRELSKIEAWLEIKLEKQGKFDLSFLVNREFHLKNSITESKKEINSLELIVSEKERKIKDLEKMKNEISSKLLVLEEELRVINKEENPSNINKISSVLKKLTEKIKEYKNIEESGLLKKIILEIDLEIKDLLKFSSGENFNFKLENINSKIVDLKNEKDKMIETISDLKLEHSLEKNRLDSIKGKLEGEEKEYLELVNKIKTNENDSDSSEKEEVRQKIIIQIEKLETEVRNLEKEINLLRSEKSNWEENRSNLTLIYQKNQEDLNKLSFQISSLSSSFIKEESRLEDLEDKIKNGAFSSFDKVDEGFCKKESELLNKKIQENEEEIEILRGKIDNFNKEQETKKTQLLTWQKDINELEKRLDGINNDLNINKIDLAREETRREDLENNIIDDKIDLAKIKDYKVSEDFTLEGVKEEISKLKNQLELIGGIDPETEKEYEETKKRYDFLFEQTEDLNKTIKSLEQVIVELDLVIKNRFDIEFKVISEKFNEYFKILFNGGQAKIFPIRENAPSNEEADLGPDGEKETDLDKKDGLPSKNIKLIKYLKKHNAIGLSGIDISATPPGKKISSVNMLSGGERALTAIALICAIISANPSPFVVLDEVDASLDESNSERLAKILDDLSNKTQFIVISHNRATMRRANVLYGVTMQNDGVSKLLSVKLENDIA